MKLYRFSPIEDKEQLFEAIKHIHFACFELCKKAFGEYLPVAGNTCIFRGISPGQRGCGFREK